MCKYDYRTLTCMKKCSKHGSYIDNTDCIEPDGSLTALFPYVAHTKSALVRMATESGVQCLSTFEYGVGCMMNICSKLSALMRITNSMRPIATSGERACPAMHAIESQHWMIVCRPNGNENSPVRSSSQIIMLPLPTSTLAVAVPVFD